MSCEASQIFFHILVLNATYYLTFPTIEDKLSGNRTIAVLGLGALLWVNQMTILLRNGFLTVLDLENPAGTRLWVKHHHIKLANGELQDEYLLLEIRQLGFQQNNVLQHSPFDLS